MSWKIDGLLIGVLIVSTAGFAEAQNQPAASDGSLDNDPCLNDVVCRARFNRGRKLSKEDNYDEALVAYESAYHLKPVPWLLINIGRTLQKMGRAAAAVEQYERYLSVEPNGPAERKQRAEQFLKEARDEVAAQALRNPPPPPGGITEPPPMPEPEPQPLPVPNPRIEQQPQPLPPVVPPVPVSTKPRTPGWLWGGLSAGGVLLLAGAGTGGAALAAAGSARDSVYVGDPSQDALDAQQRARSLALASDVLIGVGAATVGAVTITYLVQRSAARRRERAGVSAAAGIGRNTSYVVLHGSF